MEYQHYLETVTNKYEAVKEEQIVNYRVHVAYEEKFKVKWLATKLKMFSMISHVDHINLETMKDYATVCHQFAGTHYKGMTKGLQNGYGSFSCLVSEQVDKEAIQFVLRKPRKHFASFEMPIIYDLKHDKLYYCKKTPMWGAIYFKYFREYIAKHFNA